MWVINKNNELTVTTSTINLSLELLATIDWTVDTTEDVGEDGDAMATWPYCSTTPLYTPLSPHSFPTLYTLPV